MDDEEKNNEYNDVLKQVIDGVLEIEQSMLHISKPRGIVEELEKCIKDIIRE